MNTMVLHKMTGALEFSKFNWREDIKRFFCLSSSIDQPHVVDRSSRYSLEENKQGEVMKRVVLKNKVDFKRDSRKIQYLVYKHGTKTEKVELDLTICNDDRESNDSNQILEASGCWGTISAKLERARESPLMIESRNMMSFIDPITQSNILNFSMILFATYIIFFTDVIFGTIIVHKFGIKNERCEKGMENMGHYIMVVYFLITGALEYIYVQYVYLKLNLRADRNFQDQNELRKLTRCMQIVYPLLHCVTGVLGRIDIYTDIAFTYQLANCFYYDNLKIENVHANKVFLKTITFIL